VAGAQLLTPRVEPIAGDLIEGEAREAVRRRLQDFVRNEVERRLAPLFAASSLELGGAARGLVFQLTTALGCLPRLEVGRQVAALDPMDRAALSRIGVRFGTESVYFEQLLRVETQRFRALLWAVRHGRSPPPLPSARRLARPIEIDPVFPESFYATIGFRVMGGLAVRPDRLERLAAAARRSARGGPFSAGPELASIAAVPIPMMHRLLEALGYRPVSDAAGETTFIAKPRRRREISNGRVRRERSGQSHPFAKLRELKLA
ncbi:MAG: disulfide oxidoreductase, partial [Stellaceae bacterium]